MAKKISDGTSTAKLRRSPTLKQARFAAAYIDPQGANGNGVAAARAAGYRGNNRQLAVQACVNLRNPDVQHMIATALDDMAEHALHRLGEALDATRTRSFCKDGEIVCTAPEPDHKVRLEAVEFLFHLRAKCSAIAPAEVVDPGQVSQVPTRQEAIEVALDCLKTFAPHLLVATAADPSYEHRQPQAADGIGDAGPEPAPDGGGERPRL